MGLLSYLPFNNTTVIESAISEIQEATDIRLPIKARAVRPTNGFSFWLGGGRKKTNSRSEFEDSPYDFERISRAIDTDSYVKQAFGKYRDLFFKEGWTLTGENEDALDYIWARIDLMEQTMAQPFEAFLTEVVDQVLKYNNVFIAKARADVSAAVKPKRPLSDDERQRTVAGFYIIPTEKVKIKRDAFNRPISYAQVLDPSTMGNDLKKGMVVWPAEDVIHLYLDRKPGRAFGTPFVEAALDDVVSLRKLEEDILNLSHRELFPLYLYKVGSDTMPPKEGELDEAVSAIEMLKEEGGLVAPGNHSIEVLGAEGSSLDVDSYLNHFKERVAIGLGVSSHHLGMAEGTSNRSVTERLDLALYDKIKNYQSYFENAFRLFIFNPMLEEGGFQPTGNLGNAASPDTCYFDFREIDIDTLIKKENHYTDQFVKNAISWEELRTKLGLSKEVDPEQMFMIMQAKVQMSIGAASAANTASPASDSRPDAQPSATKGQVNLPNIGKSTGNKDRPINQHGRRQSPNIKNHLDTTDTFIESIKDLIEEEETND